MKKIKRTQKNHRIYLSRYSSLEALISGAFRAS